MQNAKQKSKEMAFKNIDYDTDYRKVLCRLRKDCGWHNLATMPRGYKALINDVIKVVKQIK